MASIADKIEALYDQVGYLRGKCNDCGIEVAEDAKLNAIMPAIYEAYGIDGSYYLDWDYDQAISNVMAAHTALCHVAEELGNDLGGVFHTFRQLAEMLVPVSSEEEEPNFDGSPYAIFLYCNNATGFDFIVDRFAAAPVAGDDYKDGREIQYAYQLPEDPEAEPFGPYNTPWRNRCSNIVSVKFNGWYKAYHLDYWFTCACKLESLDFARCVVNECRSTVGMFYLASGVTRLDLTTLGDMPCLTDMSQMFNFMPDLREIAGFGDIRVGRPGAALDMTSLFMQCGSLEGVKLPEVKASTLNLAGALCWCSELQVADLTGIPSRVGVTDISSTFRSCSSLEEILVLPDVGWTDASSNVFTFDGCSNLVGGNGTEYTSSHRDGAYALVDGGGNSGYFTCAVDFAGSAYALLFSAGVNKYDLVVDRFQTAPTTGSQYKDGRSVFKAYQLIESADATPYARGEFPWNTYLAKIRSFKFEGWYHAYNMAWWFSGISALEEVDLGKCWLEDCTSLKGLFYNCQVERIDVSTMRDAPNTTDVADMFNATRTLVELVGIERVWFGKSGNTIDSARFYSNSNLSKAKLPHFAGGSNIYLGGAFGYMGNLVVADVSGVGTDVNVLKAGALFRTGSALTTVYAAAGTDWSGATGDSFVFDGCTNIVGGNGTAYNSLYRGVGRARIDGLNGTAGYFTEKP